MAKASYYRDSRAPRNRHTPPVALEARLFGALVALKHPPHPMGACLPFDRRMADVWQILRGVSPGTPRR